MRRLAVEAEPVPTTAIKRKIGYSNEEHQGGKDYDDVQQRLTRIRMDDS